MIKNDDDKVVFFDIDGTLLDTSDFAETARKAAIGLMVDNGLPLDKDEAYGVLKTIINHRHIDISQKSGIPSSGHIKRTDHQTMGKTSQAQRTFIF